MADCAVGQVPLERLRKVVAIPVVAQHLETYLVSRLQQLASQLDVVAGKNNLVRTVLLFLHRLKEDRLGMLGRVNLGLSGLNLLGILD